MSRKMYYHFFLAFFLSLFLNTQTTIASDHAEFIQIPTKIVVGAPNSPGQFMALLRVGTPPQKALLVVDTGSHQTWMNCNYTCPSCPKTSAGLKRKDMFQAELSYSFKVVPCLSEFCGSITASGCSRNSSTTSCTPCGYELMYGDGSVSRGVYANETVTVKTDYSDHLTKRLKNVLIGCTASVAGELGGADGLLALGSSEHSFATKTAKDYGRVFSYCWTDILNPEKNNRTYLTFGKHTPAPLLPHIKQTPLCLERQPYYSLKVIGISVNGALLKIPSQAWDFTSGHGGFIIDSGLTLMVFVPSVYEPVLAAMKPHLAKFKAVESNFSWGAGTKLDYCFNATGYKNSMAPKLAFHFENHVRFAPPARNYIVEVERGLRCIAMYSGERIGIPMNIMGSIMQQGYHWEYDLASKKLGFAPSHCAN